MHRCLTGDHYIVVHGHYQAELSLLAGRLGLEILAPR